MSKWSPGMLTLDSNDWTSRARWLDSKPLVRLALDAAPLFVLFLALQGWILSVGRLAEASYFRPFITLELFRSPTLFQLILLLVVVGLLVWKRAATWRWTDLDRGEQWRPWILLIVAILTWSYATYDYNLYYSQGHVADRIFLVLLASAAIWRPAFLLPFVFLVTALATQFNYPIGGYSVTEQFMLVRILILFFAALLWSSLTARPVTTLFGFLLLTLVASSYWWSGLGKLRLLWFTHRHVYLLLPAAYSSGWLAFLQPESIEGVVNGLSRLDPLMVAFTLFAECGAILFLWRRRFALLLLSSWIVLHVGIIFLSGIFFWKWILVDLGLFVLLWRSKLGKNRLVFGREHFLLSIVLIGLGRFWYQAVNLSWYDVPVNYAYRVEATGESGQTYPLPPRFFAPYEYQFSLASFGYLVEQPRLTIVYGATWDRTVAKELLGAEEAIDLFEVERKHGMVRLDKAQIALLEQFIQRSLSNLNAGAGRAAWYTRLQPPSQLLSFPYNPSFTGQEPITHVDIHQVTSWWNGENYLEVRDQIVHRIDIPPHAAAQATPSR